MSWDIFVQDLPPDAQSVCDIPYDFVPKPLGKRTNLIAKIQEVASDADFSNPTRGVIEGENFSVEISMGNSENVESFQINVWGGEKAVYIIAKILRHLELRALDPSSETGIFASDT